MLDTAPTDDVADADIVRRVKEGHRCTGFSHQASQVGRLAGITAQDAVMVQFPELPRHRHRSGGGPLGIDGVSGIGGVLLEIRRELIDLDRREAGDRDVEAFHDQDLGELGQLRRQELAVLARIFRDLVVGDGEGPPLGLAQSPHLDDGDLLETEQFCSRIPAVTRNDNASFVDQNRDQKSECGDAVGDLPDLFLRMRSRVSRIWLERVDCDPLYINHDQLLL